MIILIAIILPPLALLIVDAVLNPAAWGVMK